MVFCNFIYQHSAYPMNCEMHAAGGINYYRIFYYQKIFETDSFFMGLIIEKLNLYHTRHIH